MERKISRKENCKEVCRKEVIEKRKLGKGEKRFPQREGPKKGG